MKTISTRILSLILILLLLSGVAVQTAFADGVAPGDGETPEEGNGHESPVCSLIAVGKGYIMLKEDGSVVTEGLRDDYEYGTLAESVEAWHDIAKISHGDITLGLKKDGTVLLAEGASYDEEKREIITAVVSGWRDVVDIVATFDPYSHCHYALTADGKILSVNPEGSSDPIADQWTDIQEIHAGTGNDGTSFYAIDGNRNVLGRTECSWVPDADAAEIYGWNVPPENVRAFHSSGYLHLVLLEDGTVACAGIDRAYLQEEIESWTGIRHICAGDMKAFALTEDGSLMLALGDLWNAEAIREALSDWADLAWICEFGGFVVGGKADGEVLRMLYGSDYDDEYATESRKLSSPVIDVICVGYGDERKLVFLTEEHEVVEWALPEKIA